MVRARTTVAGLIAGLATVLAVSGPLGARAVADDVPLLTFVSAPDLLNADIGDVTGAPGWTPGDPNSTNPLYEDAIDEILDQIASEDPDLVLVAGDQVEGRWYGDDDGVRIFGPTRTLAQKQAAIWAAARTYYPQWRARFAERGLRVHAALGDHEIGDNPWPAGWQKTKLVGTFKEAWAYHFSRTRYRMRPAGTTYEGTAYAFVRANTLFVTVDVFYLAADGTIHEGVVGRQLEWLEETLAAARANHDIRHIVVQGHAPALGPVRSEASSRLSVDGGADSRFWQTLRRYDVDLYLCGEVHHMTSINDGGTEQVAHGATLGYTTQHNYLVGRVYADRIELELKWARVSLGGPRLWQTAWHRPYAAVSVAPYTSAGTLTIDTSGETKAFRDRTGFFLPYEPPAV